MATGGPKDKFPHILFLFRWPFSVSNQAPLPIKAGHKKVCLVRRSRTVGGPRKVPDERLPKVGGV
jgi:hypothetical protein